MKHFFSENRVAKKGVDAAIVQNTSQANVTEEEALHWLEAISVGSTDPFHDDWPHWK